ncbi:MAG: hypothetical protein PVJ46_03480 [Methyloceanibacter sp.]|jgi:hypothetical protein
MNEVSRANPAGVPQGHNQTLELTTDQAVESAALAGAAAIQKLVTERNELRTRLGAQEQETAAYRALNNELRHRLLLVHQTYVEMAKSVVGDLERFDAALRDSAQEVHTVIETQMQWEAAAPNSGALQNGSAKMNGADRSGPPSQGALTKGPSKMKA